MKRLLTEQEKSSCPVCASVSGSHIGVVEKNMGLSMSKCAACGSIYANPLPTNEELKSFYAGGLRRWSDIDSYEEMRDAHTEFYIKLIQKFLNSGAKIDSMLDIGCGIGMLASRISRQLNLQFSSGIEISEADCQIAQNRLDKVVCGDICDPAVLAPFSETDINLITMTDVIEHIANPKLALLHINKLLSPGGFLLIDTGDVGGFGARLAGLKTPFLQDEGHVITYTKVGMEVMLNSFGFDVVLSTNEKEVYKNINDPASLKQKLIRIFTSTPNMILVARKRM